MQNAQLPQMSGPGALQPVACTPGGRRIRWVSKASVCCADRPGICCGTATMALPKGAGAGVDTHHAGTSGARASVAVAIGARGTVSVQAAAVSLARLAGGAAGSARCVAASSLHAGRAAD